MAEQLRTLQRTKKKFLFKVCIVAEYSVMSTVLQKMGD